MAGRKGRKTDLDRLINADPEQLDEVLYRIAYFIMQISPAKKKEILSRYSKDWTPRGRLIRGLIHWAETALKLQQPHLKIINLPQINRSNRKETDDSGCNFTWVV